MTARQRRLFSDYEQVKKDFAGHKNIIVTPIGDDEIPERYHVTYFVNGIYLLADGRVATLGRHEVDITLHAEYPRYKPICTISTPIWHPNFRDGQICIGDIWGAGESLTDIIINIGDMIQYKSWNSSSPLSADAAKWAIENKHLFPVGNIDLYVADYASAKDAVDIDLFEEGAGTAQDTQPTADAQPITNAPQQPVDATHYSQPVGVPQQPAAPQYPQQPAAAQPYPQQPAGAPQYQQPAPVPPYGAPAVVNDFEITAEELAGIQYVPTAQRMQTIDKNGMVKGNRVNFKTILVKGILWAIIGAILGFAVTELTDGITSDKNIARVLGYSNLAEYYMYSDKADKAFDKGFSEFKRYCKSKGLDPDNESVFKKWYNGSDISAKAKNNLDQYVTYDDMADDAFYDAYKYDFASDEDDLIAAQRTVSRIGTALWSAGIALFIGLFLGIGEGVFYGSTENAVKYAAIGAAVSLVIGFISGFLAQTMYGAVINDDSPLFIQSLIRGVGWAIMGVGVGLAIGLIKPQGKRILFCCIGGLVGAGIGGFLFNYVCKIIPTDIVARGVAILIMGLLIGVGVGLLEQFAKAAWLKVIRGEFEGKEYLVFAGTTSIGNNGKNTIVLFKDKLVGPHHCDIKLEGSKYVLTDCGTPMGTIVNGVRVQKHILKQGDAIAIGNSVLVFNTK